MLIELEVSVGIIRWERVAPDQISGHYRSSLLVFSDARRFQNGDPGQRATLE